MENLDPVRRSIKDLVMETIIPLENLAQISDVIKGYNVSTFLTHNAIDNLMAKLTSSNGLQDTVFDLLVEFKYRLLTAGIQDQDITILVNSSLDTIYASGTIPNDYKNKIAMITTENKNDLMLQLLYLIRVNIVHFDNMILTRKNTKEKE